MRIPLVDLTYFPKGQKGKIFQEIKKIIKKGDYILGQDVENFENDFARFIGSKYCIGVASGTDALFLGLKALGIGKGDEVIIPAMTFMATASAVLHTGATPVFVDTLADSPLIDASKIENKITSKTKVIIPVHLHGYPCDMAAIKKISRKYKLYVLEDACQSHGVKVDGKYTGTIGDLAAFSFYPSKNLGTFGDAGAITTSNKKLAEKIYLLRNQGAHKKYFHVMVGYNSRLDTLHAAILRIKLHNLHKDNLLRRKHAQLYIKLLKKFPLSCPENLESNFHTFSIRTKNREALVEYLKQKGVQTGIHYPVPLHLQKGLSFLNGKKGDYPNSEKFAEETLSLPMYSGLVKRQIVYVCTQIKNFYKEERKKL